MSQLIWRGLRIKTCTKNCYNTFETSPGSTRKITSVSDSKRVKEVEVDNVKAERVIIRNTIINIESNMDIGTTSKINANF